MRSSTIASFYEACRALRRYKFRGIAIFLLIIALTVGALIVWPRSYASEAKLFVRLGRESVTLDPTATTGQTVMLNESREVEINSVLEIMHSRAILEKVVDKLGPDAILSPRQSAGEDGATSDTESNSPIAGIWQTFYGLLAGVGIADPVDARQRAIEQLSRGLSIYSPRRTTIAVVNYRSKTPENAQRVADALVQVYLEAHLHAHRTSGSLEFFREQREQVANQLENAYERLRDAKNERAIGVVAERRSALQAQANELEIKIREAEAQLSAANSEVAALDEILAGIPERLLTEEITGMPNQAADAMRDRLYDLQMREQDLLARYDESHPQVQAIREQVRQAQQIFDRENSMRQQQTSTINPTRQPLELRLLTEQGRVASLSAQRAELQKQYLAVKQSIIELNAEEAMLAELQRDVNVLETNFLSYTQYLEQSRIDQELAMERISNVNVVQPATLVTKPVAPRKAVVLGLGLLLAIGGGLGVMLLSDAADQSLRHADEAEQALDLPVLGAIPQLSTRQLQRELQTTQ